MTARKADTQRKADATARAGVETRHRAEWDAQGKLLTDGIDKNDSEKVKLAKLVAETLKIRQEGERKAWQLDRPVEKEPQSKDGDGHAAALTRIEYVVVDPQHSDA